MKIQILKPTDYDISFKYICPNHKCNNEHWLFLRETRTKRFKVVCECGTVFCIKRIKNINISYVQNNKNKKETIIPPQVPKESLSSFKGVPVDILEACAKILDGYGFTRQESIDLISKAYSQCDNKSPIDIIKFALKSLEIQNV
jgi:hypothetical protein